MSTPFRAPQLLNKLFAVAIFLAVFASGIAFAQASDPNAKGITTWVSYHGGEIDSVNLVNGNLTIHLPLLSYPQRGGVLKQDLILGYNNKGWVVRWHHVNGGADINPYWKFLGGGVYSYTSNQIEVRKFVTDQLEGNWTKYGYVVIMPDQSSHGFWNVNSTTGSAWATIDGSGFRLEGGIGSDPSVLIDRNGVHYALGSFGPFTEDPNPNVHFPTYWRTGVASIQDPNGNKIDATDTLGRTTTTGGQTNDLSGCAAGAVAPADLVTYLAPGGGQATIKLCYANFSIQTNFGLSLNNNQVQEFSNPNMRLLQSVVLPTTPTTRWVFSYNSFADISSITFPAGGTLTYTWKSVLDGESTSRYVASRTLNANDGSGDKKWDYSLQAITGGESFVRDPDGNDTAILLGSCPMERQRQHFRGSNFPGSSQSRALLKTVVTERSAACAPTRVITIWPNGKTSEVRRVNSTGLSAYDGGYDPASLDDPLPRAPIELGNVIEETAYDFAQNTPAVVNPAQINPGALLRKSTGTFKWQASSSYLTANLLDLPSTQIAQDGTRTQCASAAGTNCSETHYEYDETAVVGSGVTTHLVTVAGPHGNQTTVRRWSSADSAFLDTRTTYFDTGMPKDVTDPGGHVTSFTYGTGFSSGNNFAGAYITRKTSPSTGSPAVAHIEDYDYDFNTGLQTAVRDQNGKVTSFAFDNLSRLQMQTMPATAQGQQQVSSAYQDTTPFKVTTTSKITSIMSLQSETQVDGLGRVLQTRLLSDPDPAGITKTDTTYDSQGRIRTVSNPYRTTGDSTYGVTTNVHDELSRLTKVVPPDGAAGYNNVTTAYSENVTTVTDQQGKSRKTYTDGLGRLIRVDEPGGTGTPSTAAINVIVSGTERSSTTAGQSATSGTGSVAISGAEQSALDPDVQCPRNNPNCSLIWDGGTVSITVNGYTKSVTYIRTSTATTIAGALASCCKTAPVHLCLHLLRDPRLPLRHARLARVRITHSRRVRTPAGPISSPLLSRPVLQVQP